MTSDFDMLIERLKANRHEYTTLNAVNRLIAERVGYRVEYRMRKGNLRYWNLYAPDGKQYSLTHTHTDEDFMWVYCIMNRKLAPDYARDTDAALTLLLPEGMHYVISTPISGSRVDPANVRVFEIANNQHLVKVDAPHVPIAICAAWWQTMDKLSAAPQG